MPLPKIKAKENVCIFQSNNSASNRSNTTTSQSTHTHTPIHTQVYVLYILQKQSSFFCGRQKAFACFCLAKSTNSKSSCCQLLVAVKAVLRMAYDEHNQHACEIRGFADAKSQNHYKLLVLAHANLRLFIYVK